MTRTLLKLYIPPFIILLCVGLICHVKEIPIDVLMSDPLVIVNAYPWLGIVSSLGILIWAACVCICFFAAAVLSRMKYDGEYVRFLIAGGTITAMLMLDDQYMLHEYIFPDFLHVPQNIVFCIYAVTVLLYLIRFRVLIMKNDPLILILSLIFFAISLGGDILSEYYKQAWLRFCEDGAKLFGIFSWMGYFLNLGFKTILSVKSVQSKR